MLTEPPWVVKHRIAFILGLFFVNIARLQKAQEEAADAMKRFADAFRKSIPPDDRDMDADGDA